MAPIRLICLDADDTLWEHESYFRLSAQRFVELLEPFADAAFSQQRLIAIERRNLGLYGYGVKGFTLSMLETALEIAGDRLSAATTRAVLAVGRDLMRHPIHLIDGVAEALGRLAEKGTLALITKGDLFDQESKLAASGIGDRFSGVEIVSEKCCDETASSRFGNCFWARFNDFHDHPNETKLSEKTAITDQNPRSCRPSRGDWNEGVGQDAAKLGISTVLWSDDPEGYYGSGESTIDRQALDIPANRIHQPTV